MVVNENEAAAHPDRYEYLSNERSGRTGGHLWTERVVETAPGRVRLLTAVDGRPLTLQQAQQEQARLKQIQSQPEVFIKREQNTRAEEKETFLGQLGFTALGIFEPRITTIDDNVTLGEQRLKQLNGVVHRVAGLDHQHDAARTFESVHEVL